MAVIEERIHLHKKSKIHCQFRYGYFVLNGQPDCDVKFNWFWPYIEYKAVNLSTVGFCQIHSKLSYFLLILSYSKENFTLTWPSRVQNVLLLTITGEKLLFTILSVNVEILTPFSSLFTLRLRLRMYLVTSGC